MSLFQICLKIRGDIRSSRCTTSGTTGGKFAAGINDTSNNGGKIYRRCHSYRTYRSYRWKICHCCSWHQLHLPLVSLTAPVVQLTYEYLCKCSEKFHMALILFSLAWRKTFHEKNLKQNILWHCSFKINNITDKKGFYACVLTFSTYTHYTV